MLTFNFEWWVYRFLKILLFLFIYNFEIFNNNWNKIRGKYVLKK